MDAGRVKLDDEESGSCDRFIANKHKAKQKHFRFEYRLIHTMWCHRIRKWR